MTIAYRERFVRPSLKRVDDKKKSFSGFPTRRVTFKAQLKVGWWTKHYIECYIPKYLSYPEVYESARIHWPLLVGTEKSKMASKMATRNKCEGLWYMNICTDLMYLNSSNQ